MLRVCCSYVFAHVCVCVWYAVRMSLGILFVCVCIRVCMLLVCCAYVFGCVVRRCLVCFWYAIRMCLGMLLLCVWYVFGMLLVCVVCVCL